MKYIYLSLFLLTSCTTIPISKSDPNAEIVKVENLSNSPQYNQSVSDAKRVEDWEVSKKLSDITINNPNLQWKLIDGDKHVLVTSWKAVTSYYKPNPNSKYYNTDKHDIWVTLAPRLQNMCSDKNFGSSIGLDKRLMQILGLHPDSDYKAFVEFWVKPRDMFRPCPDAETTDSQCDLSFPKATTASHRKWIENQRATNNYPWTQLGYTYDWNPSTGNHVGLSEFIIRQYSDVVIAGIHQTKEYCGR